ncbi:MAG: methyltransferase domain-containing protein [Chloroflexi bacterium]|nr:methyltransferase domain-containing protein [Chloroflexota bacterium]
MPEMLATPGSSTRGFTLACPVCRWPVVTVGDFVRCASCGRTYAHAEGIWRFLPPERVDHYQPFLDQYRVVRRDQGWGSSSASYYRQLPWVEPTDPQQMIWSLRRQHYQAFVEKVLQPLEQTRGAALTILDLGAGNGWLSNRLSARGHNVAAIDINVDRSDGLAARIYYEHDYLAIQAEFDRLPLAPGQADLVIYNGSLHYACDVRTSLHEGMRILRSAGQLVIVDSPFYEDPTSGEAMVHERQTDFAQRYGFAANPPGGAGFITRQQFNHLGRALSVDWRLIWSTPGWRRAVRGVKARLIMRREPAQFPIIQVKPYPDWKVPPARRLLRRLWQPYLRWNYRVVQQPRSRRPHLEQVNGRSIMVFADVFNPRLFRSGEYFARQLNAQLIPPGCSVLDMGTGTGLSAISAAQWARRVLAVDINTAAVHCAQANVLHHGLAARVEVRQGNLFSVLGSERFDVVLFNPPYLRGTPASPFEQAFFSNDIAERFASGLSNHLSPGGYALLLLSSQGDTPGFLQPLRWQGFSIRTLAEQDWVAERFTLYQAVPEPEVGAARHGYGTRERFV